MLVRYTSRGSLDNMERIVGISFCIYIILGLWPGDILILGGSYRACFKKECLNIISKLAVSFCLCTSVEIMD